MIRCSGVNSGRTTLAGMNGRKAGLEAALAAGFTAGLTTVSVTQISEARAD
jgi:hypothetical protein